MRRSTLDPAGPRRAHSRRIRDADDRSASRARCARSRQPWPGSSRSRPPRCATEPEAANFDARPDAAAAPGPPGAEAARDRLRERLGRFGTLTVDDRDGHAAQRRPARRLPHRSERTRRGRRRARLRARQRDRLRRRGRATSTASGSSRAAPPAAIEHLTWEQRVDGIPVADAGLARRGDGRRPAHGRHRPARPRRRAADDAAGDRRRRRVRRRAPERRRRRARRGDRPLGGAEQRTRFADGGRASLALYRSGERAAARLARARAGQLVRRLRRARRRGRRRAREAREPRALRRGLPRLPGRRAAGDAGPLRLARRRAPPRSAGRRRTRSPTSTTSCRSAPACRPGTWRRRPDSEVHLRTTSNDPSRRRRPCPTARLHGGGAALAEPGRAEDSWALNRNQSVTQLFYLVEPVPRPPPHRPGIQLTDGAFRPPASRSATRTRTRTRRAAIPSSPRRSTGRTPATAPRRPRSRTAARRDHRNNANFLALPDGLPGLMQMYLWMPRDFDRCGQPMTTLFGGYDGANDASLVFHEFTHGLSDRLVTDAAGFGALGSAQAGAIGEGRATSTRWTTSWRRASSRTTRTTADVRVGRYLDDRRERPLRFQPIDCKPLVPHAQCPDRGSTIDTRRPADTPTPTSATSRAIPEVHADGEIWAQTLWSLRAALIDATTTSRPGPRGRGGTSPPACGSRRPSPRSSRCATRSCRQLRAGDDIALWSAFAARGMGYFASPTRATTSRRSPTSPTRPT